MAFNLYFAGSRFDGDKYILKNKACRLFSFANERKEIKEYATYEERGTLLVDSGAFSIYHSGAKIDIDEYIQFINDNPRIEHFIELDVIPYPVLDYNTAEKSAQGSWENYLYMIERVNDWEKILPVYHFGEDVKYFKRILEFTHEGKHIPYICVGGRHGVSTLQQEEYFNNLFTIIKESSNPNVKVHVLGMTVLSLLEKYPFYSADSTSYLMQAIYGTIMTRFGPVNVSSGNKGKNNFIFLTDVEKKEVLDEIKRFGYTLEDLQETYTSRIEFNIDYCLNWARNYEYKPKIAKKASLFG